MDLGHSDHLLEGSFVTPGAWLASFALCPALPGQGWGVVAVVQSASTWGWQNRRAATWTTQCFR